MSWLYYVLKSRLVRRGIYLIFHLLLDDLDYRQEQNETYAHLQKRLDNTKKIRQISVNAAGVETAEKESGYLQKVTENDNLQKLISEDIPEIFTKEDFQDVLSEDDFQNFFEKQLIQNEQNFNENFDELPEIKLEEF